MTQQNGVSPQAPVETTPSSHTPQLTTSTASQESMPQSQHNTTTLDSSVKPSSDTTRKPGTTITGRVEIPKLSPATTELLARVTGSFKTGASKDGFDSITGWGSPSFDTSLNNKWKAQGAGNMKSSSAFLEITPSQLPPSRPDVAQPSTPAPAQKDHAKSSTGIMNLAPKPAEPSTQLQPQVMVPGTNTTATKQQKAPAAPRARHSTTNGTKRTIKRRRRGDYDDGEGIIKAGDSSSDESDITPMATQTKSGRQVNRPSLYVPPPASSPSVSNRNNTAVSSPSSNLAATTSGAARKRKRVSRKGKDVNINCVHCQRGHSPFTNAIVFCDWCNRAWHQLCHDPCIDNEVVLVKEKEWLCKECKPVPLSNIHPTVVRSDPYIVQTQPAQIPLQVPPLEVGGSGFSDDERRGYLSSLSHATLVELLVTLSDRNPDLPIFPERLKSLPSSEFPLQSSMSFSISAAGPANLPVTDVSTQVPDISTNGNLDITGKQQGSGTTTGQYSFSNNPSSATKNRRHGNLSDEEESEYEVLEDHRLYPRAGNGLHLSLKPDDLDIMREDPACSTFSYSLHGSAKARAEANDAVPVWGTA